MANSGADWAPTDIDIAYWRFLRLTGRFVVAWLCPNEGAAFMWARPRDQVMRHAFMAKHAGHEHIYVSEILNERLEAEKRS